RLPAARHPRLGRFQCQVAGRRADGGAAHRRLSDPHAAAAGGEPGFDLREPDGAAAPLFRTGAGGRATAVDLNASQGDDDMPAFPKRAALLAALTALACGAQAQTTLTF